MPYLATCINIFFIKSELVAQINHCVALTSYEGSDSQSLLHEPQVVREVSSSGPQMPIQIDILCFLEHYNFFRGGTGKVGNPCTRVS